MQNVRHTAQNAGCTVVNVGHTLQNVGCTMPNVSHKHRLCANPNDSGHSFDLIWQGFHEIWVVNTWQGTNLPNRSDLREGVGQGIGLPKMRSTEVKGRVGGGIF